MKPSQIDSILADIKTALLILRILVDDKEKYFITKTLDLMDEYENEIKIDKENRDY